MLIDEAARVDDEMYRFHLLIELVLVQNPIQTVIENVAGGLDHAIARNPELLLPLALFSRSHRHAS
ncbi:MAG: hypothetical protein HYX27_17925 [Acidobacteria bacterium]|nr:hypothetical protein [Acidobacteriota bacterium]